MFNFELLTQSHVAHVWSDTNGNILIAEKIHLEIFAKQLWVTMYMYSHTCIRDVRIPHQIVV